MTIVYAVGAWIVLDADGYRIGPAFGTYEAAREWVEGKS
jgi:hypothetical protein